MPEVILQHQKDGEGTLQAVFNPDKGMNLISLKKGDVEIIDQSTRVLFDERFAGLGALIGPHFHHRNASILPHIQNEELFPHIARVKAKGIQDPFSHGIARYAPWTEEHSETSIKGRLTGKDLWNGVPLSELEGQNFTMDFKAHLDDQGLHLSLSVVSDTDSLVGIHYYYALPNGKGRVISETQDSVRIDGKLTSIPTDWKFDPQHHQLVFDMQHEADYTFRPYPDPLKGTICLETEQYKLKTVYDCPCAENCWQLYHPKDASFVCIEPISAQNPHAPRLTVSNINIHIDIQLTD